MRVNSLYSIPISSLRVYPFRLSLAWVKSSDSMFFISSASRTIGPEMSLVSFTVMNANSRKMTAQSSGKTVLNSSMSRNRDS